jgi:2-dehydropantoate 2-reductase
VPNITIVGPGAIGGLVAARLCQDSANNVTVVARTSFEGLRLEAPDSLLEVNPPIVTDPDQIEAADWFLVATKAYDSEAAATLIAPHLGDSARVAILQNGVDQVDRFAAWLPRERILPVVVDCPAERIAPGRIRQRGPALLSVPRDDLGAQFSRLFTNTGLECRLVDDFTSIAWSKLCLNAAGVINALVMQPARIAHDEFAAGLMRRIVEEAAEVGRAEGATLADDVAEQVVRTYMSHPPDSLNSLHADRAAGRPMEIELRNGIIVKLGMKHAIATPFNAMAVALLKINTSEEAGT